MDYYLQCMRLNIRLLTQELHYAEQHVSWTDQLMTVGLIKAVSAISSTIPFSLRLRLIASRQCLSFGKQGRNKCNIAITNNSNGFPNNLRYSKNIFSLKCLLNKLYLHSVEYTCTIMATTVQSLARIEQSASHLNSPCVLGTRT